MDYHFLQEDFNPNYKPNKIEYSFLELLLPINLRNEIITWGRNVIKPSSLFIYGTDYGFEHNPHISVLYDIMINEGPMIEQEIRKIDPPIIKLGKITKFPHKTAENKEKYEVVKIDVFSPSLISLQKYLQTNVPNNNKYESYIPHITLAYIIPGSCDTLVGNDYWEGTTFTARLFRFKNKKGKPYDIYV